MSSFPLEQDAILAAQAVGMKVIEDNGIKSKIDAFARTMERRLPVRAREDLSKHFPEVVEDAADAGVNDTNIAEKASEEAIPNISVLVHAAICTVLGTTFEHGEEVSADEAVQLLDTTFRNPRHNPLYVATYDALLRASHTSS